LTHFGHPFFELFSGPKWPYFRAILTLF
jgi:hypothetical protein